MTSNFHHGDCIAYLKTLEPESISAVVTDPPYHLQSIQKRFGKKNSAPAKHGTDGAFARSSKGFMGKSWDGGDIAFRVDVWAECLRVLKPGGYLLAFGGTRTYHRLACAIEDAGFEIRDMLEWVYSGMPKSHNVGLQMDKAAGAQRKIVSKSNRGVGITNASIRKKEGFAVSRTKEFDVTEPETKDAVIWSGWGTATKPCHEPIVMARKPITLTVAENVLKYGTGAINIDASRVETNEKIPINKLKQWSGFGETERPDYVQEINDKGRWPGNIILDGSPEVLRLFPNGTDSFFKSCPFDESDFDWLMYCAKPNGKEKGEDNDHPTVKPKALLKYLVNMVTTLGAIVLDPFMGSGTAGVACAELGRDFVGCDIESEYMEIARRRIAEAEKQMVLL